MPFKTLWMGVCYSGDSREIGEKYIADVTASFENPAFSDSLSLPAFTDSKVVERIDGALIHSPPAKVDILLKSSIEIFQILIPYFQCVAKKV